MIVIFINLYLYLIFNILIHFMRYFLLSWNRHVRFLLRLLRTRTCNFRRNYGALLNWLRFIYLRSYLRFLGLVHLFKSYWNFFRHRVYRWLLTNHWRFLLWKMSWVLLVDGLFSFFDAHNGLFLWLNRPNFHWWLFFQAFLHRDFLLLKLFRSISFGNLLLTVSGLSSHWSLLACLWLLDLLPKPLVLFLLNFRVFNFFVFRRLWDLALIQLKNIGFLVPCHEVPILSVIHFHFQSRMPVWVYNNHVISHWFLRNVFLRFTLFFDFLYFCVWAVWKHEILSCCVMV